MLRRERVQSSYVVLKTDVYELDALLCVNLLAPHHNDKKWHVFSSKMDDFVLLEEPFPNSFDRRLVMI